MTRKKNTFKILVIVVFVGILIFFSNTGPIKNIRSFIVWSFGPFMKMAGKLRNAAGLNAFWRQNLEKIVEENQRFKTTQFEVEKLRIENSILKKTLSFKEEKKVSLKGLRVLFYAQELGKEFLLVDQGEDGGIQRGDLVVDAQGLILGKISEAGKETAKVEIASNAGQTFEVEIIPLGIKALAKGMGARIFDLELIPLDSPLKIGDFVVMLNTEKGGYVSSLLMAEIASIKSSTGTIFKEGRAYLLARPEFIKEVFIIK